MEKVKELLSRMEQEILEKVNSIALEKDAEIKASAQKAYDEAIEAELSVIKAEVESGYETAKSYLLELLPVEEEVVEPIAEEVSPEIIEEEVV